MRILRITLNNIASLAGTHTVDFTRDPLRSAGLFSISGATGAGKSTLLDALCLALYGSTPRLRLIEGKQVPELTNGDKQTDPRALLRRGTGDGFAEVAFVGVDGQPWTSRWRVRRSRRSAEGNLQNVEMVLYKGHIPPGGDGPIEEGGRKSLVLQAIEDRIGLKFEQFTRAVLLAQNDFATFLKADDKERAEILQALTGTTRFETISKAVFLRCGVEQKALESLESQLAGNAPLSEEARAEAESARTNAEQQLTTLENRQKELQSHADWFSTRSRLVMEKTRADEILQEAMIRREAGASRRQELARTEQIGREARSLRASERFAQIQAATTAAAVEVANTRRNELELSFRMATDQHQAAVDRHASLLAEQKACEPLLRKSRAVDERLLIVQSQYGKARTDLETAKTVLQVADEKLRATIGERNLRLHEQQSLQQDRDRLKAYVPFVADSALWLHRIDTAVSAIQQADVATAHAATLAEELMLLDTKIRHEEESRTPLQAAFESSSAALVRATEAEKQFDTDLLAKERSQRESARTILTALFHQLKNAQSLRERAKAEAETIEQLQAAQEFDATAIEQIRSVEIPLAENAIEVAKSQLEFIQAAVDDHSQRLRLTLQDGRECPVCGSTSHPYSLHAPELETTAVKAAKKSVRDLEKKRDEALSREARLRGSLETRSSQIETLMQELAVIRSQIVDVVFESQDHPDVASVLAVEEGSRLSVMEARLLEINGELRTIEKKEQNARNAAKQASDCREARQNSERALKELDDRLQQLLASRGILNETTSLAAAAQRKAKEQQVQAETTLQDLWSALPQSRSDFETEPAVFREQFERAAAECGNIERRIADLTGLIQQADAAIQPLEHAVADARASTERLAAVFADVSKVREELLKERGLLFDGRSADEVEEELAKRLTEAAGFLDAATRSRTEADRLLVAAGSECETKAQAALQARAELTEATAARERWVEAFTLRTSSSLTLEELDSLLARDEVWIQTERDALRQLDEAVTASESACHVYAEQLQQHMSLQPSQDEEQTVLAGLQAVTEELAQARSALSEVMAVILSDEARRAQNLEFVDRIRQQEAKTDPWRRLNDLIGSADGSKFRSIAQRRTLDLLLGYANHQLNHLAARYRLERIPGSLNLMVLDCDMGEERRSVHSLSGGESFLVSLALALGLASLTSNRLRIESLFIDEGFGSLDPETLNTAMGALMHLEAQGRKVGVISHVTEMTDAIPVQIKVIKGRGGASRIVVPGQVQETPSYAAQDGDADADGRVPPGGLTQTTETIAEVADRLLSILHRERDRGRSKVSTKALREELACDQRLFKAAQLFLSDQVVADGRSLRLAN